MERDDTNLIYFIINKLGLSYMQEEIIDVAYIGYTRALNSYTEDKGAFSTLAYTCIKNEILRYLKQSEMNVRKANFGCLSLNVICNEQEDEHIDIIKDDFDLEKFATDKMLFEKVLETAKKILNEKQYDVLIWYYMWDYTDNEIAKSMNVSVKRVNQIRHTALKKLQINKTIAKIKEGK